MIRRPPRSTQSRSSAASDVYKRQVLEPRALNTAAAAVGSAWTASSVASRMAASGLVVVVSMVMGVLSFRFVSVLGVARQIGTTAVTCTGTSVTHLCRPGGFRWPGWLGAMWRYGSRHRALR